MDLTGAAPRKPKQLYRLNEENDEQDNQQQYMNYDLFQNEETTSFLSQSFCSSSSAQNHQQQQQQNGGLYVKQPIHSSSLLDITTDDADVQNESTRTNVKFFPILYLLASGITLFGGIISSFHQRKLQIDTLFPQFLEMPFRSLHLFQLGIILTSLTGVINYSITYIMWKQSNYGYTNVQFFNCLIGILSQISILIFSILPVAMPNALNLRSEDCMFLNLYFILSFVYQCIYIFTMTRSVPNIIKMAYSYQIRIAFFVLCVLVFSFYITSGVLRLEGSLISLQEQVVQNANSICAYILFGLNTVFISLFYFDLKTVNLILKFAHIQDIKKIRKFNQNIL